jgi:Family of unknown function (DUF6338)
MFDFISPSNFDFFAHYFLAGFIIFSVRSRYVLGEKAKATDIIFESVVLSLLNQLVFLIVAPSLGYLVGFLPAAIVKFAEAIAGGRSVFFLEVLILPGILGTFFGINLRRGWNSAILRRLSMPTVHPTRRAYDFAFGDTRQEGFVIITFADGTMVYGYFGPASLAASDSSRSDIYLERLYDVIDGVWSPTQPPKSALLMLNDLRSIEFIEPQKETDNGTKVVD